MTDEITPPDPLSVVDNTAWVRHEPVAVELRCATADAEVVTGWFARADVSQDGDETVLCMAVSNSEALIDRVLTLVAQYGSCRHRKSSRRSAIGRPRSSLERRDDGAAAAGGRAADAR